MPSACALAEHLEWIEVIGSELTTLRENIKFLSSKIQMKEALKIVKGLNAKFSESKVQVSSRR